MRILYDLSHHNLGDGDRYDFATVAQNADGIIYKCTDPEVWPDGHDHTHVASVEGFREAGLPVAEYHFHDPSISPQNNIALYVKHSRRGFADLLDVEDQETLTSVALTAHVVNALKEGAQRTGRKWGLYGNFDFLDNRLLDAVALAANFAFLWLAWPAYAETFPKPKRYGKSAVAIWQKSWTRSCPGIKDKTLDYNEWQWSEEKWIELVGQPQPLPPTLEQRVAALEATAHSH